MLKILLLPVYNMSDDDDYHKLVFSLSKLIDNVEMNIYIDENAKHRINNLIPFFDTKGRSEEFCKA